MLIASAKTPAITVIAHTAALSSNNGTTWTTLTHTASTATNATITGLTTKTAYQIRVSTKNTIGFSTPSALLSVTTL